MFIKLNQNVNNDLAIKFDKKKNSFNNFSFQTFYDINETFNFDKILIRIIIKFNFENVKKYF